MSLGSQKGNIKTYELLDRAHAILSGTRPCFWPFLEGHGNILSHYGTGDDARIAQPSDEATAIALEAEFSPIQHPGGVFSYFLDASATGNTHINMFDDGDYSQGDGTTDNAFSIGCWIRPTTDPAASRSLMAKFGTTAANVEEFDFRRDASGNLELELHDFSVPATEIATASGDAMAALVWNFCVATYDGAQADPRIHLYRNGVDGNSGGLSTETGAYVAMAGTASSLLLGCRDATGTPELEYQGYYALPFLTNKELSAAEVTNLLSIGQTLLGI